MGGKKTPHQHREILALFKEAPHLHITEGSENTWPYAVLNKLGGIILGKYPYVKSLCKLHIHPKLMIKDTSTIQMFL